MKRFISLALSLAMLAMMFSAVSCGKDSGSEDTESGADTKNEENVILDDLPRDLNYNGATVMFHVVEKTPGEFNEVCTDYKGESVNDAIYNRDLTVSERLNVKFDKYEASHTDDGYDEELQKLNNSILASSAAYDIVGGIAYRIPQLAARGVFLNLLNYEYINLDAEWWNDSATEAFTLSGNLPLITGDIGISFLGELSCYAFNEKVAEENNLENLYDVVREGKWTLDYLNSTIKDMWRDLNSNGLRDEYDQFGQVVYHHYSATNYQTGAGIFLISKDENGIPHYDINEERMSNFLEKLKALYWDNNGFYYDDSMSIEDQTPLPVTLFTEDRCLFIQTTPKQNIKYLSGMDSKYGVLPSPKLNEEQSRYYSEVSAETVWGIPLDVKDPNMSSAVLEALAAESYRTVTTQYFDLALKYRYASDANVSEMMDLIRDTAYIDFAIAYNEAIGYPLFGVRQVVGAGGTSFSSFWAANKRSLTKMLDYIVNEMLDNAKN